jgi:chemotaxis protein histidine kinase CheA
MAADITDDFQKELVELFVQEAQEWLENIHVALDELQQGPAPERHTKLVQEISGGVTNLGGSAATIDLQDVTQASFATLPFIEALQDPQKGCSAQDFLSLCKQLGQIQRALTNATGMSFDGSGSGAPAETPVETVDVGLSPGEFLQALQALQEKQSSEGGSGFNIIRSLIEQAEGLIQAGVERVDATNVHGYLTRVSDAEESFLRSIDEGVPEIMKKMSALKLEEADASLRALALEATLQEVTRLWTEAQQVNAGSAVVFFTGLHSFLTVAAQRQVDLAVARVESVMARLHAMGGSIRLWVEQGRAQRAEINQMLAAGQG